MPDIPRFTAIALLACLSLNACERADEASSPGSDAGPRVIDSDVAFVGVDVIPMTSNIVLSNQTVLVKNAAIVALGAAGDIAPDADAVVLNGSGRYLIPGLADMHVHIDEERNFLPLVAYGVLRSCSVNTSWSRSSRIFAASRSTRWPCRTEPMSGGATAPSVSDREGTSTMRIGVTRQLFASLVVPARLDGRGEPLVARARGIARVHNQREEAQ